MRDGRRARGDVGVNGCPWLGMLYGREGRGEREMGRIAWKAVVE